jgi:hypothetical protein
VFRRRASTQKAESTAGMKFDVGSHKGRRQELGVRS